jgi:GxxExxY protein
MDFDDLSNRVIGASLEVHKHLGAGLLESAYEAALVCELKDRGINFKQQASLPVQYKNIEIDCAYRIDLLIENTLIVELKAVEKVLPIHQAQLMTYMKLANIPTGLLINFNTKLLKNGIKRVVL